MTQPHDETPTRPDWRGVDHGWGRMAVDFAALLEPAAAREYVGLHHRLRIDEGDRVLDMACGSGFAIELARARGAVCAGIDASTRLIDVARDRNPGSDLRVGDMNELPWEDGMFDVVTSFRGIWGTTPDALAEARRVLAPGGRIGVTVWGHIKQSPGAWALSPFRLARTESVANQAAMVTLGRPGVGEELLAAHGFEDVARVSIPFAWEFADPDAYARALASTGPAFEAIEEVGVDAFLAHAVALAEERVRDGLPLRAEIDVVGFVARAPDRRGATVAPSAAPVGDRVGFVSVASPTGDVEQMYAADVDEIGFVMNTTALWAHHPAVCDELFELIGTTAQRAGITYRQRGVLVAAAAAALGDSYCSLAWGRRLADVAGIEVALAAATGDHGALDPVEAALARWATLVVRDPNATRAEDADGLRTQGFDDAQIVAITIFVALRLAFSSVNDALGAPPDHELTRLTPQPLVDAITFGRPPG